MYDDVYITDVIKKERSLCRRRAGSRRRCSPPGKGSRMRKLYEERGVLFAVLWIAAYCLAMAPIPGAIGCCICLSKRKTEDET